MHVCVFMYSIKALSIHVHIMTYDSCMYLIFDHMQVGPVLAIHVHCIIICIMYRCRYCSCPYVLIGDIPFAFERENGNVPPAGHYRHHPRLTAARASPGTLFKPYPLNKGRFVPQIISIRNSVLI